MELKAEILIKHWNEYNKNIGYGFLLDSDFVNNVLYPAMEEYAKECNKDQEKDSLSGFYAMFKGGFTIKTFPHPFTAKGEGLLLLHPDDMPKNKQP